MERIRLRDGSCVTCVDKAKYLRCEQIRNYILRSRYERGVSMQMAILKAMCRFHTDEKEIRRALFDWKRWFYGNGRRHRPIELFIQEDKARRSKEEFEQELEKWKQSENGQVSVRII